MVKVRWALKAVTLTSMGNLHEFKKFFLKLKFNLHNIKFTHFKYIV